MIEVIDLTVATAHPKLENILNRNLAIDTQLLVRVGEIIDMVRAQGDEALCELTQNFDGIAINPGNLQVDPDLIKELASQVSSQLLGYLRTAIENVRTFHQHQLENSWQFTDADGVTLGQRLSPFDRVGLYVPGGKAAFPSTLIMNAVPAIVAGVAHITVVTPPTSLMANPVIAAVLKELKISEVYSVSGAHAIAALAFGTEIIPRVDKIVGNGNVYVAAAKKLVFGSVDIDSISNTNEIVIIADRSTPANFVAADLISQAECDTTVAAMLITTDAKYANEVKSEISRQLTSLPRRDIAERALSRFGAAFVVGSLADACQLVNRIAPEHVALMIAEAESAVDQIKNAGAIFIGPYSCEAAVDYFAGSNHVLPTGGTARFSSPLGVYDFLKRTNIIKYNKAKLEKTVAAIVGLAECESFTGHARAAMARFAFEQAKERATRPLAAIPGMDLDED